MMAVEAVARLGSNKAGRHVFIEAPIRLYAVSFRSVVVRLLAHRSRRWFGTNRGERGWTACRFERGIFLTLPMCDYRGIKKREAGH